MHVAGYLKRTRLFAVALLCSALLLVLLEAPLASAASWPNSMASTGDSITRAYNTGWFPFADAPANSWSTGTLASVNSHYNRILAANPTIRGKNYNDGKSGARMSDLNGQMGTVVGQGVQYVTVLMGANDICSGDVNAADYGMTSVATFSSQFDKALRTLTTGLPGVRVFVGSIPSLYNLWSVLKDNGAARSVWALGKICQPMLKSPTSTATADVNRRNAVKQRNIELNAALQTVCARFSQCRFDNNAIYNTVFVPADVSTRDYFHPSLSGQTKLAQTSWAATFPFAS